MIRAPLFRQLFALGALILVLLGADILLSRFPSYAATTIVSGVDDFKELSDRFTALADERGAVYAFEVLKQAKFPPNTDLHLLGHVIGDELYKQKGAAGVADCTQDFRNACSHSIVIGALTEFGGDEALSLVRNACEKAPGGKGAYTMCFHGFGHGVFAYYGYELEPTINFCKRTGTSEHKDAEYPECVGGAIMELMGGGGHNHDLWQKARERYLFANDSLSPCMGREVPDDVKSICLTYLTPRLFEAAGADLQAPDPATFPKAFGFCREIPASKKELRDACFASFGKEFDTLVADKDIRLLQKGAYTDEQLRRITEWCELAGAEGTLPCVRSALGSLFWGGENNPEVSERYCTLIPDEDLRPQCFEYLAWNISFYIHDEAKRSALCAKLPEKHKAACNTVSKEAPPV